ncbi:MAG: hypothetical protein ACOVSR_07350 [Bacteroidia bacterium]
MQTKQFKEINSFISNMVGLERRFLSFDCIVVTRFMKIVFFIIFFQFSNSINAQSFKNNWTNFKCKSWRVCFYNKTYKFLDEDVCGQLEFINKKDTSLKVCFTVFDSSKFKKTFSSRLKNWLKIQSCVCFGPKSISSFYLMNNFYLVQYCTTCCFIENSDCDSLRIDLLNYRSIVQK